LRRRFDCSKLSLDESRSEKREVKMIPDPTEEDFQRPLETDYSMWESVDLWVGEEGEYAQTAWPAAMRLARYYKEKMLVAYAKLEQARGVLKKMEKELREVE
jgi:hypothetical protein